MSKTPITVVVITKNEEHNIETCLGSIAGWADEIIVVDDESRDRTIELAEKYTDRIFHRRMDIEGKHRNWAYAQARNEWVFSLDADESATPEIKEEISRVIQSNEFQAYTVPRRNYLGDYWVRHGGQYPSPQLKLFMKSRFRFEEVEVHPRVFLEGKTGHLTTDIIHKSYRDIAHFVAKLNGQTTLEAKKWMKMERPMSFRRALWRAMDRFPRTYLRKKGYKDGFVGFMFSFFASVYQIVSYAKYWEMKKAAGEKKA